ncbi:PTI1-like tyrosine-protein kinase At3g15890, partial [Neltuma alba]|uniref:PTI1-like tyrosine-protein kinase At3g15890 n=1 Tax=Neltuma alba TaxID=207710 RepID=UPI0010A51000
CDLLFSFRYLHHQATPRVIHRGIKASNVLLDADFEARISGFEFAKLIGETHESIKIKGIVRDLMREYTLFGKALESWDVCDFGILLLELASGKRPIKRPSAVSVSEWEFPLACDKKFRELADSKLKGKFVKEELERLILVGVVCAQSQLEERPTMLEVVDLLKGEFKDKFSQLKKNELFRNRPAFRKQIC